MTKADWNASDTAGTLTIADLESLITRIVHTILAQKPAPPPVPDSYEAQIERIKEQLKRPYDPTAPSLADIALNLAAQVPEEEWAQVPQDASKRYKEYLYGTRQSLE